MLEFVRVGKPEIVGTEFEYPVNMSRGLIKYANDFSKIQFVEILVVLFYCLLGVTKTIYILDKIWK